MSVSAVRVLMAGPDRSVKGGISSVVNQYYAAGLDDLCDLAYVGTVKSENRVGKALDAAKGYRNFRRALPDVDVVHIHASIRGSFKRKRALARMAHDAGKRLIIHNHSGEFAQYFEQGSEGYRRQMREFYGWADRVVVLSEEWRAYFAQNVCEPSKITVIHNSVVIPVEPVDARASQDVLFLGRLGGVKCPDILLRAAAIVLTTRPGVRFRFGGDGSVSKYAALAEELGIAGSCEFLGWVSGADKEKAIRASGIYCLPSRHECMPMSVLEAMSYGLATIATPVGGTPQIIEDGANGYMTPVGDHEALAARISTLLDDPELRQRIGDSGRATVVRRFDSKKNVQDLMALYESLVGGKEVHAQR